MSKLHFITVATGLFSLVFLFHVIRALTGWEVIIGTVAIPMWVSWIAIGALGILVVYGKLTWLKEFKSIIQSK